MAKEDTKDETDAGEGKTKAGGQKKLILIIVGVLVLVIFSVGGTLMVSSLMHKEEPAKKTAKKKSGAKKAEKAEKESEEEEKDAKDAEQEGEEAAEGEEDDSVNPDGSKRVAAYYDFEQPFVVNFMDENQMRYLQVTVSVMFLDPKTPEEIKRHMPLIRNNLVMLFSNQTRDAIISREGKEKVRTEAEAEVKKLLKERAGRPLIKSLYFTSFVMQ